MAVAAAALAIGTTAIVVTDAVREANSRTKQLPDGSILVLNRVSFGGTNEFTHGRLAERILGNAIPAKGIKLWSLQLARPTRLTFDCPPGKSEMVVEFKVTGPNAATQPLVKPAFYHEFRCVIRGESGIEYVQDFWPGEFRQYPDGYFGLIIASRYPRESRRLWLRVERREKQDQGGPWTSVAEFSIENPVQSATQAWSADGVNTAKKIDGLEISLGQITVVTQAYSARDMWNHVVTVPFQVRSNGLTFTNWSATYVQVEDASGNWDYNLAGHRSLDPRYVWKLDANLEPESDFPPENLLTVNLPKPSSAVTVNLMNMPVTISWDGIYLDATMPTNRTDLALKFVCVTDEQGRRTSKSGSGSWNQHYFREGNFMMRDSGIFTMSGFRLTTVTFAIVPNVRTTFYAQPQLLNERLAR
ncbi:MAG TPA: hypothetical protein VGR14_00630 [Verrucomicrobiae bacterium]|nr:hypothetical protein [Verrucomicrobiae bacterium]